MGRTSVSCLFEPVLLLDQAIAVAGDQRVHAHRLADQIGDHGQHAHVVFKTEVELVVPFAIDGQRALRGSVNFDRHAEKAHLGHRRHEMPVGRAGEIGMGGDVLDHQRHAGCDDMVDHLCGNSVLAPWLGGSVGRGGDFRLAVIVERENEASPHLHEGGQHRDHRAKRPLQGLRPGQDFRDYINPGQGNIFIGRRKEYFFR